MQEEYGLYVWPRSGWLASVRPEDLRNDTSGDPVEGGQVIRSDHITWLDSDNGLLCTCGSLSLIHI